VVPVAMGLATDGNKNRGLRFSNTKPGPKPIISSIHRRKSIATPAVIKKNAPDKLVLKTENRSLVFEI
jgi:hypothetical protein